ncbi:RidA family protein [Vagococcus acidifermentans]|uniref:Regulator n=1 Tax=Vagococcus acidifermentans TaxID=564710 RepID=A0A430AY27_9ENTE|nr:RidA family protein [Vagococcus acidifermentans]RSU12972.1 regulator [Vagococcus acidifermentans]
MKKIETAKAPAAIGPYVQGNISGNLLFSSGQIPIDPATGDVTGTTIKEQTHQVMKNIAGVLETINGNFDSIVKTTCFIANMDDFAEFNEVYAAYFGDVLPARSCVEVSRLPKDVLVEVELIAEVN